MPRLNSRRFLRYILSFIVFAFALHFFLTFLGSLLKYARPASWSQQRSRGWNGGAPPRKLRERVGKKLELVRGGLRWGPQEKKLGNLFELISTSKAPPKLSYYDKRAPLDRLRLSASRVVGHRMTTEAPEDNDDTKVTRIRRHVLVTGGFGSLGKHVIRDILMGSRTGPEGGSPAEWSAGRSNSRQNGGGVEEILITILDVVDRTPQLNSLLQRSRVETPSRITGTDPRTQAFTSRERTVDSFKRSGKLRIIMGDVRNSTLLASILSPPPIASSTQALSAKRVLGSHHTGTSRDLHFPPVTGIIHLAAYRPELCEQKIRDCESVAIDGMKSILEALKEIQVPTLFGGVQNQKIRPWMLIPRRGSHTTLDSHPPSNLVSESTARDASDLLRRFSHDQPLHSLLLHLPSSHSIIGDPFSPRFDPISHIVHSALAHLPLTFHMSNATTPENFLGICDASQAIIQGTRMLELAARKEYLEQMAFVAEVEIVGPDSGETRSGKSVSLAEAVVSITRSQSPLSFTSDLFPTTLASSARSTGRSMLQTQLSSTQKTALSTLRFTPMIPMEESLRTYITTLLRLQTVHLSKKISIACSSPSQSILEEGLLALSGCSLQLLTIIDGSYHTLGCSDGVKGPHLTPIDLLAAVPYKEGVRGIEFYAERGVQNKVDMQIRCPASSEAGKLTGESEVIVWVETKAGGQFMEESAEGLDVYADWYTVEFVNRESRAFTLTLPPTEGLEDAEELLEPKRILTLKKSDVKGGAKTLAFHTPGKEFEAMLWRVNPICCGNEDKKGLWDYFKEDPLITSQVSYPSKDGKTSLAESTLAIQRCQDYRGEHEFIQTQQNHLVLPATAVCSPPRGDASSWLSRDLPICSVDCSAPLACVATEKCRCARDRCGNSNSETPFDLLTHAGPSAFGEERSLSDQRPDVEARVKSISLDSLILPGAKNAFATSLENLPKAHVLVLPKDIDNHLDSEACWKTGSSRLPFTSDHLLIEAFKNRSVAIGEADFILLPYYQGCYYNHLQENTFKKLTEATSLAHTQLPLDFAMSRVAIPFTHDFGSCTGWWPRLEDLLGRKPPFPMAEAVAWQVNGDYNTKCVKPERDVIIPAVSRHTQALINLYGSLSSITPASERPYLAFFAGGIRGFGAFARTRIGCGRHDENHESDDDVGDILYQQFAPGKTYLQTLNQAKFCLLPRGIPAWTTRTFEAIYAGCIPTFIVDSNIFPFQDILDYSLFSVTIPENEAHLVDSILSKYDSVTILELQANLLKVREAFVFREDGREWEGDLLNPARMTLVSMKMRLDLAYPEEGSCLETIAPIVRVR